MIKKSLVSLVLASVGFSANAQQSSTRFLSEQLAVPYGSVVASPVWQLSTIPTASRIKITLQNGFGGVCGASVVGVNVATIGNQALGSLKNIGQGMFESNIGRTLQLTHLQVLLSQTSYNVAYCKVTATAILDQPLNPVPIDPSEDGTQTVCGILRVVEQNPWLMVMPTYWLDVNGRQITIDSAPISGARDGSYTCVTGDLDGDYLKQAEQVVAPILF